MEYVTSLSKIPQQEHYAVIESDSVHIPGDERSRTNPGHGYPAHTKSFISYKAFVSLEELKHFLLVNEQSTYKKQYVVLKVNPVNISFNVDVKIDE